MGHFLFETCFLPIVADSWQSLIPVVMSGIIAVYGLVIAVLIAGDIGPTANTSLYTYVHWFCSRLRCAPY